jgi:hypothetical protein
MAINLGKDGTINSTGGAIANITNWELSLADDALETSAFGGGWDRTYVPGLRSATATASGYFAEDDAGALAIFSNMLSSAAPALEHVHLKYGSAATAGYHGNAVVTGVTIGAPNDGLQTFSANLQFTAGVAKIV